MWFILMGFVSVASVPVAADTVTIFAGRDATLIEDAEGGWANGTGSLFVGRTSQTDGSHRRAVLRFDLEGVLPPRAIIKSVELLMYVESGNASGRVSLHRLLSDWSEGPTFSRGGGGRPSQSGDVTWIHSSFPLEFWVQPGGDFVSRVSASSPVEDPGPYTWTDRYHMMQDVRLWLRAPSRNFGWILIGDESQPQTAKVITSREHADPAMHPQLIINYRLPGSR